MGCTGAIGIPYELPSQEKTIWERFIDENPRAKSFIQIINVLREHGELTSGEICQFAGKQGLWKRLSEMEKQGLISKKYFRICTVTKRPATVWILT